MDETSPSEWQSIRPWLPPLALSVREITSVSATFILSSTLTDTSGHLEPSLASLGLTASDDDDDDDDENDSDEGDEPQESIQAIISEALSKGLSVNVNGSPWQRVLIRVDDQADEAVIIIFGLMPGRQYDIDLGLIQGGQNSNIRRQVVTQAENDQQQESVMRNISSNTPEPIPSTSAPSDVLNGTSPDTSQPPSLHSSPSPSVMTLEDRAQQLKHVLSLINSERDTLTASLKSARREAQKADAALRSEIDILKRASEKHTAAEHRARQKVLALQEAVKRAQIATTEMETLVKEVEDALPQMRKLRDEKESEYALIKEESDRAKEEREKEGEKDRKRVDSMGGELTSLGNRVEKLNGKKEKLEGGVIPDLEAQLQEIEKEIERVEADPYGYTASSDNDETHIAEPDARSGGEIALDQQSLDSINYPRTAQHAFTYAMQQRHWTQPHTHIPGTIGRPPPPIQRPAGASIAHQPRTAGRHSYSVPHHVPFQTLALSQSRSHHLVKPQVQGQSQILNPNANSNSSSTTSPTTSSAAVATSVLSSRAQPFEPSRAVRASTIAGGSVYTAAPVHRHTQHVSSSSQPVGGTVRWPRTTGSQSSGGLPDGTWGALGPNSDRIAGT